MAFNHNDHYHRLLLRHLPSGARRALDVGCGTGTFARALAGRGLEVDAVDPSADTIKAAQGDRSGEVRFVHADITSMDLPSGHYDVITCLASLHHMPFEIVTKLRDALAPGGVLLVLGCYPEATRSDYVLSIAAIPVNAAMRLALSQRRDQRHQAPVMQPSMPLPQIKREAATLLPGARIRRLLFWRYLLVYRRP